MENETAMDHIETAQQQAHDQQTGAAKIEEVFRSFGEAFLQLEREQAAIRGTLTQIIEERVLVVQLIERLSTQFAIVSDNQEKAAEAIVSLGKLGQAIDQRVQLLTGMLDLHHGALEKHGLVNPRLKADPRAN